MYEGETMKISIKYGYATTSTVNKGNVTIRVWWVTIEQEGNFYMSLPLLFKPTERQVRHLMKLHKQYRKLSESERDKMFLSSKAFNFVSVNEWSGKIEVRPL